MADQGKGNPHASKNVDNDDERWERREGYEYRTYGEREGRPPGWEQGEKDGLG